MSKRNGLIIVGMMFFVLIFGTIIGFVGFSTPQILDAIDLPRLVGEIFYGKPDLNYYIREMAENIATNSQYEDPDEPIEYAQIPMYLLETKAHFLSLVLSDEGRLEVDGAIRELAGWEKCEGVILTDVLSDEVNGMVYVETRGTLQIVAVCSGSEYPSRVLRIDEILETIGIEYIRPEKVVRQYYDGGSKYVSPSYLRLLEDKSEFLADSLNQYRNYDLRYRTETLNSWYCLYVSFSDEDGPFKVDTVGSTDLVATCHGFDLEGEGPEPTLYALVDIKDLLSDK